MVNFESPDIVAAIIGGTLIAISSTLNLFYFGKLKKI